MRAGASHSGHRTKRRTFRELRNEVLAAAKAGATYFFADEEYTRERIGEIAVYLFIYSCSISKMYYFVVREQSNCLKRNSLTLGFICHNERIAVAISNE